MKLASSLTLVLITSAGVLFPLQGAASSVTKLSMVSALSAVNAVSLSSMAMVAQSKKTLKVTSSQQAIQLVKHQYPGKVLKVQSSRVKGNPGYQVKLLSSSGAVFYVTVDAKTGSVRRK